jgi:hypothetical protein
MDWVLSEAKGDPAKAGIAERLCFELYDAAAAGGASHALVQLLLSDVNDMLLHGSHDVIEAIPTVAPGTSHLVISFRISDTLRRYLATAASDCVGVAAGTHLKHLLH